MSRDMCTQCNLMEGLMSGGTKGFQMDFDAKGPGGNEPGDTRTQCNLMEGLMSGDKRIIIWTLMPKGLVAMSLRVRTDRKMME